MNSSNNGTVKAVSPWLGLQIIPFVISELRTGPSDVTSAVISELRTGPSDVTSAVISAASFGLRRRTAIHR